MNKRTTGGLGVSRNALVGYGLLVSVGQVTAYYTALHIATYQRVVKLTIYQRVALQP
jgi:hypothetical protein